MTDKAELIPREEIAERARGFGLKVTVRTLRYWALRGLIPKPTLIKHRAYYSTDLLPTLMRIEALRPKTIEEIKQATFESDLFHCELVHSDGTVIVKFTPRRKEKQKCLGQNS